MASVRTLRVSWLSSSANRILVGDLLLLGGRVGVGFHARGPQTKENDIQPQIFRQEKRHGHIPREEKMVAEITAQTVYAFNEAALQRAINVTSLSGLIPVTDSCPDVSSSNAIVSLCSSSWKCWQLSWKKSARCCGFVESGNKRSGHRD
ncbi:multidrug resistance-associated ABC transporter [Pseudozyma hubeiensis SY62]|uniref:Multidrug resistance-associated ABC transporter n=1 Tax=Pseudozyma hubeiensis (strain SY62) TaxID=1305764 RepID=R9P215_PSEHS|nr:multidrug resistance-associated ABC transporter [Pseudozyma hubeiensis SY62]GAC95232.1 multidrug resistance-associated ABC transporter [Pseudozyma hubeiensis SY62]